MPSRFLLSVLADVFGGSRVIKKLGHFLVWYEADENLILH